MNLVEYRQDIEARLDEARKSLADWQSDSRFVQTRLGDEPWQDAKPMMITNAKRVVKTYENILKWLDAPNP